MTGRKHKRVRQRDQAGRNRDREEVTVEAVSALIGGQPIALPPLAGDEPEEPAVRDPATALAKLMLTAAFHAHGPKPAITSEPLLFIEAPRQEWVATLAKVYLDVVTEEIGSSPDYDEFDVLSDPPPKKGSKLRPFLIVADETPRRGKEVEENDRVTQAIIDGRPIIGISNNAAFLPKNFIRAEPTRIAIDTPTREMIENVAARMTNTSCTTTISPKAVEAAEPTTLRLAIRPGQSAGDFLARLERLAPAQAARSEIKLADLPGIGEAADWGRALAQDIRDYKAGKIPWAAIDKGALLYGYPGTGKTTFAKAVAAECGLPLLATSYAAWQSEREGNLGDVVRALRRAFDQARQQAPSILFIDEIDSLGTRNSSSRHDEWWRAIVNALLEQLDGLAGREGVIVIAASNHPDHLDPALRRSGRLDKMIEIRLPDRSGLAAIMRAHLGDDLRHADLSEAAARAHVLGATGADVEKWVRGARRRARQENREVDVADLVAELPAEADERTADTRLQTAVHEIGHAIMRESCFPGTVEFVTIRQSGIISGIVKSVIKVELLSEEVVQNHLVCKLAGRAAEEVVFGQPSGSSGDGPQSDLADATMLAFSAVSSLAFDGDLVWRGVTDIHQLTQLLHLRPELAGRVQARLKAAYDVAVASLARHKHVLEAAARKLVEKESLTGDELRSFLAPSQADKRDKLKHPNSTH